VGAVRQPRAAAFRVRAVVRAEGRTERERDLHQDKRVRHSAKPYSNYILLKSLFSTKVASALLY